jgi:hypothetical protein
MTDLIEQDNAKLLTQVECLISDMNERLKRLEDLYFSKGQETNQPIDTTGGEPIETEQRWQPKLLEDYYYINDWFKVRKTNYTHHDLDNPRILAGNCFRTEQEAQKAAEAIKQYLSINKF